MSDTHFPTVGIEFIKEKVLESGLVAENGIIKIGSTTTIIITGQQAIYKRSTLIRELVPGEICLEQATAVALKFSFLGVLLDWLL